MNATTHNACRFCDVPAPEIVHSGRYAFAFRDELPVTDGHTLIIPRRHVTCVFDLEDSEYRELWEVVCIVRQQLVATHAPDGFTIGVNDGEAAGQTVPHAHVHIIPRRRGDVEQPRGGIRSVIRSAIVDVANRSSGAVVDGASAKQNGKSKGGGSRLRDD